MSNLKEENFVSEQQEIIASAFSTILLLVGWVEMVSIW